MRERYLDRYLKLTSSERECQGLYVKLPFMDRFAPVLDVFEVEEAPSMLMVRIASASYASEPLVQGEAKGYVQNFFVHESQVIFRECERWEEV